MRSQRALAITIAIVATVVPGCPGGAPPIPDVDLSRAREWVRQGNVLAATQAYLDTWTHPDFPKRTDEKAEQARALMLTDLYRLNAPQAVASAPEDLRAKLIAAMPSLRDASGSALLCDTMAALSRHLSTSIDPNAHIFCSTSLAQYLDLKIRRPALRRSQLPTDAWPELLYRRLLRTCVSDYELFALARQPKAPRDGSRAADALEALAAILAELSAHPESNATAAEYWSVKSAAATAAANVARRKPDAIKLTAETREFVESDLNRQLQIATRMHDIAVKRATNGDAPALIIESFEDALKHALFALESIAEPTDTQAATFTTARVDYDSLKRATHR